MKKLITALLLLPSLTFGYTGGDAALSAALIGATAAGAVTGTQYAIYQSLMWKELKGWQNKETGTTTVLESNCSINAEFHLLGDHRENYLLLGIMNPTKDSIIVKYTEVEFVVNGKSNRFPGWRNQPSDREIKSGWWEQNYVPFPSKVEFADYETVEVKIPLQFQETKSTCTVTANFKKTQKIHKEEVSYSIMDLGIEGGPALFQTGPTKKLGKPDSYFGLSFNVFGNANHGAGFTLLSENGFDGSDSSRIQGKFSKGKNYQANSTVFAFNYVYRHFLTNKLTLNYEPAIGWQTIYDSNRDNDNDNGRKEMTTNLVFTQKLMLNWAFAQASTPGVYRYVDFFAGVGIVQIFVPSSSIGGENLDGSRFGALLRIGMGI